MRKGFTLAEVLITLGIIGVVAALTIPGLINNINEKVTATQKTVMEKKLIDGLNMLSNRENGLNVTYNNTEEFVRALSKYLKITTICGKDNLSNCIPYSKINYENNVESQTIDVSSITSASKLKLVGNWLDPAGFILADGSFYIISYNNDCGSLTDGSGNTIVDPDRPMKSIPAGCIDGLMDINNSRTPNKYGKDVLPFFAAKVGARCVEKTNGVCIATNVAIPTPTTLEDCEANKSKYGINACSYASDYWAGAVKACKDQGMRLPTYPELTQIASVIYDTEVAGSGTTTATYNASKVPSSFPASAGYTLWSSYESSATKAFVRGFAAANTNLTNKARNKSSYKFICVDDE